MGLEKVVERILDEGEQEARQIRQEAEAEAEAILEDAREEAEREARKIEKNAEQEAESKARRIEASAQLDGKKKRLNAEADVLATVRTRVEEAIGNLDKEERGRLLKALVAQTDADELGKGAKAWTRPEDKDLVENLGFTYEGEIECLGGAVIESPDGTIREDLRFETELDRVWRESVHDIATEHLER